MISKKPYNQAALPVGEEVDVRVMPNLDDLTAREFSAVQIRQSEDAWNSLYLAWSDAAFDNSMDSYDSSSSAFAGLKEVYIRETCELVITCMEELAQARLKEGQSPADLWQCMLREKHDGLDQVSDRLLLGYLLKLYVNMTRRDNKSDLPRTCLWRTKVLACERVS